MAAFSCWRSFASGGWRLGFLSTTVFLLLPAALTAGHVAARSWEQLQRLDRSDLTERKMSAEPVTRSEVFGQLRKELYGEEPSTGSDTHIFIILGASVSINRQRSLCFHIPKESISRWMKLRGEQKNKQRLGWGETGGGRNVSGLDILNISMWQWHWQPAILHCVQKMCRINLFHCQSMKSEVLFVTKFWSLCRFFLSLICFTCLLSPLCGLGCVFQGPTLHNNYSIDIVCSLLLFLQVWRFFCSSNNDVLLVPHSWLVCTGRSGKKEDLPYAVVRHCAGTTTSLCAWRSLTLGKSSSWLPWTNNVPPLGGCSGMVCSRVTRTLLVLPAPTWLWRRSRQHVYLIWR